MFGLKAGLSISTQEYDYENDVLTFERDPRTGLAVSVYADFPITPIISLQPGVGYIQRGSKIDVVQTSETDPDRAIHRELDDRIDYLSMPLYVKAVLPSPKYRPYLLAGPRLDWKINDDSESSTLLANRYETFVYGGSVGAGLEYGYGAVGTVILEFAYQFDLSDAADMGGLTIRNQSFLFLLGYTF
ncbi:PorT family protein [bacterium]|nr:PorT family protein [bacterium]